jgi:hypothetical protein
MEDVPENLLKGAYYALEQCGLLLRDAHILDRYRSCARIVVLASFARDELRRYDILLGFLASRPRWERGFHRRRDTEACNDPIAKQRAGMFSTTMRADSGSGLDKILRAKTENHPDSQEYQNAETKLNRTNEIKIKRTAGDRDEKRS